MMKALSVLLVDDQADLRALIVRWLEKEGYQVTCAGDGAEAAQISQVKTFDLLITDMIMPERDGVQLMSDVKRTRPGTRVLAMSGGSRVLERQDCLRIAQGLGAHAAVMKPFKREDFLAAVSLALGPRGAAKSA